MAQTAVTRLPEGRSPGAVVQSPRATVGSPHPLPRGVGRADA